MKTYKHLEDSGHVRHIKPTSFFHYEKCQLNLASKITECGWKEIVFARVPEGLNKTLVAKCVRLIYKARFETAAELVFFKTAQSSISSG